MCLMLLLFIAASLQHVGFHLMPFLTICNLKIFFKALHSQRVQVPLYREQMDVIIQGHLSASSELLVSGFNCFDWCLRWKHLELAVAACSDFFRLLQTPYSACCLRHTAGYHYKFFLQNFFFLINTIICFLLCLQKLSIAQEHMWRYTNCLSTNAVNDIMDICIKRYECLTLVLYIYTVNLHNIKVSPWQTRCMKKIFRDN